MDVSLPQVAYDLVSQGKGIFAADAGPKSLAKRGAEIGLNLESVADRLKYRELTLQTSGLNQYIGGVILDEEALSLGQLLKEQNILMGVKVDQGTAEAKPGSLEKITLGLDGLVARLAKFKQQGAAFAKWRAVIIISNGLPTFANILQNAKDLAQYALLSQQAGLVPIVEPEVLMDGDHSISKCESVTKQVGYAVFEALAKAKVDVTDMLYKTNMVVAGKASTSKPSLAEVTQKTLDTIRSFTPTELPAIVFLSGGQEAVLATQRLNEIAKLGADSPWRWSFSFERAIEEPAMQTWQGRAENVAAAQKVLLHRAKCNSLASMGKYTQEVENEI